MHLMTETLTRPETDQSAAPAIGGRARIRVAVVGATGYAGGEMVRILHRHPNVDIVGLVNRDRDQEPVGVSHPHLSGTGHVVDEAIPAADAVFLALPHRLAAERAGDIVATGATIIDQGPDFRLRDPADYPRWYGFEHPAPELLARATYGLPELHRDELAGLGGADVAIVGAAGCYPTTSILAVAPLARAGLVADIVVDAKSGVSGAGRDPKAHLTFSEVNESVSAYGLFNHRHTAEIEQELGLLAPDGTGGAFGAVDFLPHLIPMTRGILAAAHIRPTRPVTTAELRDLYRDFYAGEPFVQVVDTPPATKHVTGSNLARVFVTADERTGRVIAIGVLDNLVKGAAGQAVQCFNLVFGLPETAGLEQLPLNP